MRTRIVGLFRMTKHLPIPQVPQALAELDRAIELLGERAKGLELRASKQDELVLLLHAYPNVPTAAAWQSELKRQRQAIATSFA